VQIVRHKFFITGKLNVESSKHHRKPVYGEEVENIHGAEEFDVTDADRVPPSLARLLHSGPQLKWVGGKKKLPKQQRSGSRATASDLKLALRTFGLSQTGNKDQLIGRLKNHEALRANVAKDNRVESDRVESDDREDDGDDHGGGDDREDDGDDHGGGDGCGDDGNDGGTADQTHAQPHCSTDRIKRHRSCSTIISYVDTNDRDDDDADSDGSDGDRDRDGDGDGDGDGGDDDDDDDDADADDDNDVNTVDENGVKLFCKVGDFLVCAGKSSSDSCRAVPWIGRVLKDSDKYTQIDVMWMKPTKNNVFIGTWVDDYAGTLDPNCVCGFFFFMKKNTMGLKNWNVVQGFVNENEFEYDDDDDEVDSDIYFKVGDFVVCAGSSSSDSSLPVPWIGRVLKGSYRHTAIDVMWMKPTKKNCFIGTWADDYASPIGSDFVCGSLSFMENNTMGSKNWGDAQGYVKEYAS
jgi:hypothetical protein